MSKNVLYITDEYIFFYNLKLNKLIIEKIGKNIVINGRIANLTKFNNEFERLLRKNNLKRSLFIETLKIIVTPNYTSLDTLVIKNIFEKLNYRKIKVVNELKLYNLSNNTVWINATNNYIIISFLDDVNKENFIFIESKMFKDNDLLEYIKNFVGDKDIYLIGNGNFYELIKSNFEEYYNNIVYTFNNAFTYLIDSVTICK